MKFSFYIRAALLLFWLAGSLPAQEVKYVIHISVDGGGSHYILKLIDEGKLPNFKRLQTQGACTFNARTDYDYTVTLPNHTCQVTGRGVVGPDGHNWTRNTDPPKGQTLHTNKGSYVAGVFDVAHDHGLRTAMFTGKTKFSLFDVSYDADHGAADTTAEDNGRDKIDTYVYNKNSTELTDRFIADMKADPFNFAFVHYAAPDAVGHRSGWGSPAYNHALMDIDKQLGRIFELVTSDPTLHDKTAIVLTADHGGKDHGHGDATNPLMYIIPFCVWGPGVPAGADLYELNANSRLNPGISRPHYADKLQPIRNGDAANLELKLLGLGPVPGSTINFKQDLHVRRCAAKAAMIQLPSAGLAATKEIRN